MKSRDRSGSEDALSEGELCKLKYSSKLFGKKYANYLGCF